MRILYLTEGLTHPNPGPQKVGRRILDNLLKISEDFNYYLITDKRTRNIFSKNIYYYLDESFSLPEIPGLSFELKNYFASRALKNICKKLLPDLIHIHGYSGYYPSPPRGYKALITFHDYPPMMTSDNFSKGPLKYLEALWLKRSQMIRLNRLNEYNYYHSLSSEISDYLKKSGIPESRIFTILNGIEKSNSQSLGNSKDFCRKIRKLLGLNAKDKLLIMIGTTTHRKGLHLMKMCLKKLPNDYHFIILGNKPKIIGNQYLKSIITGYKSKNIHYLGYQPPNIVKAFLKASDCYLSLSLSEACQLAPLEALSLGIPVIITDCGAAKDIFGKNYEFLLPVNPPIDLLRKKIMDAVESSLKRKKILIKHETWLEVSKALLEVYKTILDMK